MVHPQGVRLGLYVQYWSSVAVHQVDELPLTKSRSLQCAKSLSSPNVRTLFIAASSSIPLHDLCLVCDTVYADAIYFNRLDVQVGGVA